MISRNQIRHITSLHLKKKRDEEKVFFVEGSKMVVELLNSPLAVFSIYASGEWIRQHLGLLENRHIDVHSVTEEELAKISALTTPQQVLALVAMTDYKLDLNELKGRLTLILDDIKDPGNFGTIIRVADWFGIENIICSENTVDVYNPKVVQATMGSVFRVKVFYARISAFLKENNNVLKLPVYGAAMAGPSIYDSALSKEGFLVLGNESSGIGPEVMNLVSHTITIPSFASDKHTAESLNVAIATAIVCSEFRRRNKE